MNWLFVKMFALILVKKQMMMHWLKNLQSLCDIFVMDAFGTAHRAQASTVGVAKYAPIAAAGPFASSRT